MITTARLTMYKDQAWTAVHSQEKNPNAPGVSCVNVTPYDLLALIQAYEKNPNQMELVE